MKHSVKVTLFLVLLFLLSHIAGLAVIYSYTDFLHTDSAGQPAAKELPLDLERPDIDRNISYIYIAAGVIVGTGIALLLLRFKKATAWKLWFVIAIWLCLSIAFSGIAKLLLDVFIDIFPKLFPAQAGYLPKYFEFLVSYQGNYSFPVSVFAVSVIESTASLAALIIALIKTYKPNVFIHNLAEVFIYGGLAAIFVPVVSIYSAIILLILISIYDTWAVFGSKHMIKLALAQSDMKMFAGLSIPYKGQKVFKGDFGELKQGKQPESPQSGKIDRIDKIDSVDSIDITDSVIQNNQNNQENNNSKELRELRTAVLGGGDIGFSLLFSGAVMMRYGIGAALLCSVTAGLALLGLLLYGKANRFYPAMPAITLGCLAGYGISLLVY